MHLDLDFAWPSDLGGLSRMNLTAWGPRLRFIARSEDMEKFARNVLRALDDARSAFLVYGSGDFHHLSALWLRRFTREPVTLVSFDNHPDWDIRPPHWCCGGWINRALESSPNLERVSVWGLANFEYWWPGRIFTNRGALRRGRLEVHAWRSGRGSWFQRGLRAATMTSADWQERFRDFARSLAGRRVYVTIDMDCLSEADATTNWEQGRFSTSDVAWAVRELRSAGANVVGGDLCGAWSEPRYGRFFQRFAARMDHPKLPRVTEAAARAKNGVAFEALWPALTGVG